MGRPAKPWYREKRKTWYAEIGGVQHNLGPDKEAALTRFHELTAEERKRKPGEVKVEAEVPTVADIFQKFLDWCEKHRSQKTYLWCRFRIRAFIKHAKGKVVNQPFDTLKPFHVVEWSDKDPDWSPTYKHGMIAGIQRPFNWACKMGHIDKSPIRHIEKPGMERREQYVTVDQWKKIRDHYVDGDPFRDILEWAWECGARPQEAKGIEARHVQLASHRIYIPKEEAKGKKRPRIIYMTPHAEAIVARLMAKHPTGPLFRNNRGNAWSGFCMNNRFIRLKKHLGVKFAAMSLRHGFATRKLEQGMSPATVAALMGHRDLSMISRYYSHLDQADEHLQSQLNLEGA